MKFLKEKMDFAYAAVFILVSAIAFCSVIWNTCANYYTYHFGSLVSQNGENVYNGSEYAKTVQDDGEGTEEGARDNVVSHLVNAISDKKGVVISKITTKANEYIIAYDTLVKTDRVVEKTTGIPMGALSTSERVDVLEDDYLFSIEEDTEIDEKIASVVDFAEYCADQSIDFLYMGVPSKFDEDLYDGVYEDCSVELETKIFDALEKAEVPALCMSEELSKLDGDRTSYFFKTDHHWLPQTGIWADGVLAETLNALFGYQIDSSIFDLSNYSVSIVPNSFLGSHGTTVTEVYAEREDFPIVLPEYETNLTVFNPKLNKTVSGSIEETLLDEDRIVYDEEKGSYTVDYSYYGYGDNSLFSIHNTGSDVEESRILFIKASYADVMYPYFCSAVRDLDVIDLRAFQGSLKSYMEENTPDAVVIIYGVRSYTHEGAASLFVFD